MWFALGFIVGLAVGIAVPVIWELASIMHQYGKIHDEIDQM